MRAVVSTIKIDIVMKLVEVLSVAIAALSSIGFAAIPADYVELESIVVPRGVTLDVGTTPE